MIKHGSSGGMGKEGAKMGGVKKKFMKNEPTPSNKDGGAVKGGFPDLTGDGKVLRKIFLKVVALKDLKAVGVLCPVVEEAEQ